MNKFNTLLTATAVSTAALMAPAEAGAAQPQNASDNGTVWVDVTRTVKGPKRGPFHCFVDMGFVIDGTTVVEVADSAAGLTACKPGDKTLDLPEGHADQLEELRTNWDKLMWSATEVINDAKNESTVRGVGVIAARGGESKSVRVAARIGQHNYEDGRVELSLYDASDPEQYGPDSCIIADDGPVNNADLRLRTYGQVEYMGNNYEVASIPGPDAHGSACGGSDVVLLDISTEEIQAAQQADPSLHGGNHNRGSNTPQGSYSNRRDRD